MNAGVFDRLFDALLEDLEAKKLVLRRGTLVDATIVQAARKQRKKEEAGDENTSETPRQMAQRDCDATATKKGKIFYYGYKGHIGVDQGSGIIRKNGLPQRVCMIPRNLTTWWVGTSGRFFPTRHMRMTNGSVNSGRMVSSTAFWTRPKGIIRFPESRKRTTCKKAEYEVQWSDRSRTSSACMGMYVRAM